jgi:hypothetical protein
LTRVFETIGIIIKARTLFLEVNKLLEKFWTAAVFGLKENKPKTLRNS